MTASTPHQGTIAVSLENEEGGIVRADLRLPEGPGPFPGMILLPGFKGFKDWGMFPPTAERFRERGIATLVVNSSKNGLGDSKDHFVDEVGFSKNTPGREKRDVELVLHGVREGKFTRSLDPTRLGILGHSRGGGVALLVAADDPELACLVGWASIATFYRYTKRALAEWRRTGRLEVPNMRTGQMLWLDRSVLEDLEGNRMAYDLERAARRVKAPSLWIHGEQDEAVDASSARELEGWSGAREKCVEIISPAGHTFGAVHPWTGATPAWERAVNLSLDWCTRYLQ